MLNTVRYLCRPNLNRRPTCTEARSWSK